MLKNYLKMAFRVLLRRKFYTFISLFGIAFTLIILMVVVAIFDRGFAPSPPEVNQERTLLCIRLNGRGPQAYNGGPGYRLLDRYTRNLPYVETSSFCTHMDSGVCYRNGIRIGLWKKRTDSEFWRIFQFKFIEGAPYSRDDVERGRYIAVINEATRQKFFGNESAIGRTIEMDGRRYRISGVVANVPILRLIPASEVWIPIHATPNDSYKKDLIGDFIGIYMLHNKSDIPSLKSEFKSVLRSIEKSQKEYTRIEGGLMTNFDYFSNQLFPGVFTWDAESHAGIAMAAIVTGIVLFMLLPAVNLININVCRILERASEIGVRKAFGASSNTLVGQFVIENVLLSLVGGLLGLAGAYLALDAIESGGFIPYTDFHLNLRVFGYGFFLAVFFGLLSGVYPAWRMSRLHPAVALRGGVR